MTQEPLRDGTFTAVVDRFEEDMAVLVVEDDGETVGEYVTSVGNLPDDGRKVNAVLTATFDEGEMIDVSHDEEETERRQQQTQNRFDRLSQRPGESENHETE